MVHSALSPVILEELRILDARRPGTVGGLCARFIAQQEEFLRDLRVQAGALEPAFVRAGAHRLKGSAGALGAQELAECAARLERAASLGDPQLIGNVLDEVRAALAQARAQLGAAFGVSL